MTNPSKASQRMVPADQPEATCGTTLDTFACALPKGHLGYHEDLEEGIFGPWQGARPATPSAPATPPVGAGTSEGATGAQIGAGEVGLGDALRLQATTAPTRLRADEMRTLADRADALERVRDSQRGALDAFQHDLTNLREGLMERVGRYTPSDADLLAYVDALKAQVERVRVLLAEVETTPGLHRITIGRRLRAALDGAQ